MIVENVHTIPVNQQGFQVRDLGGKDYRCRNFSSRNSLLQSFSRWKIRFKTQMGSFSDFPSGAVLCVKEVEMVDSVDEFKPWRSIEGKDFGNFEMLDARNASALNKIIQNSYFKKRTESPEKGLVPTRKTDRPS